MRFRGAAAMVVTAVAVLGLAALPAGAASGQVMVFDGSSTSLDPPMQLSGGSGTLSFESAFCEEASPASGCWFQGGGNYTGIVCGTGSFSGYATYLPRPGTRLVNILFVAGVGVVTGSGYGLIDIVPTGVGSSPNCLTRFKLAGVLDP